MPRVFGLIAFLAGLVCTVALHGQGQDRAAGPQASFPELIVYNGRIVTVDDASFTSSPGTIHEALAVEGDRILATGTSPAIRALAGPRTRQIDLKGRTMLPSFMVAWPAAAQPAPVDSAPSAVTVSIADTAAPPEWELRVPITVNVAGRAEVARVTFRLEFPSPTLAFASLKATDKLEEAGFEVSAGKPVTTGATGSIAIELLPARKEKRLLRSGVAVILVFKVSVDAEETSFTMTANDVKAWGPAPASAELRAASERDGLFVVSPAGLPIFACFFYMH